MKLTIDEAKKMMEKNFGSLDLSYSKITELPENLKVGGWLNLSGTKITKLPDSLKVGSIIFLPNGEVIKGEELHLNTKEDIEMEI